MTALIIGAVVLGIAAGRLFVPDELTQYNGIITSIGLCLMLFLVGLEKGQRGGIAREIKESGPRVLLVTAGIVVGTLSAAAVAGLFLPMSVKDALATGGGFGWYSLSPMLLSDYSPTIAATSFLCNVMREVSAIVLVPIVARYVGYVEAVSLPGAAAMDTLLPVVVKSTDQRIAIYSLVSGLILSILVPIVIPIIIAL